MEWLGVDRRRLGTGMLVFGVVGLVLAGVVAAGLLAGGIAARKLDDRLVASQNLIAASLTRLTLTTDSLATSVDDASTTLGTSRDGVVHARDVLTELASATDELASALDVSIVGNRPFDATVARLHDVSARVRAFEDDATKLAANLDTNAGDVSQMAAAIRQMRSQVADLAGAVVSFDQTGDLVGLIVGGIVLGALLTAWIAVAAGAMAWAGWRLRRIASAADTGPASEATSRGA